MNEHNLTLVDLQAKIAKHAWEDPAFEAEFMADPKASFEKHTGQKLPAELAVHAHYNTPTELHFVLPKRAATASDELTDDDLERVAGGEIIIMITIAVSVAGTLSIATTISAELSDKW